MFHLYFSNWFVLSGNLPYFQWSLLSTNRKYTFTDSLFSKLETRNLNRNWREFIWGEIITCILLLCDLYFIGYVYNVMKNSSFKCAAYRKRVARSRTITNCAPLLLSRRAWTYASSSAFPRYIFHFSRALGYISLIRKFHPRPSTLKEIFSRAARGKKIFSRAFYFSQHKSRVAESTTASRRFGSQLHLTIRA